MGYDRRFICRPLFFDYCIKSNQYKKIKIVILDNLHIYICSCIIKSYNFFMNVVKPDRRKIYEDNISCG